MTQPSQFTFDVSTNIGKIRRNLGDKDRARPLFYDEEITEYLSENGSDLDLATAACLEALANRAALRASKISLSGGSLVSDQTKPPSELRAQAKMYRERAYTRPYTTTQELEDANQEIRDSDKGKWDHEYTDAPSD
jgi:hypothetical protein